MGLRKEDTLPDVPEYGELEKVIAVQQQVERNKQLDWENSMLKSALSVGEHNAKVWGELINKSTDTIKRQQNELEALLKLRLASMEASNDVLKGIIRDEVQRLVLEASRAQQDTQKVLQRIGHDAEAEMAHSTLRITEDMELVAVTAKQQIKESIEAADMQIGRRRIEFITLFVSMVLICLVNIFMFWKMWK